MRPSVMKVSAKRNSFQFCRNKKIATVASAGRVSGSTPRAKIRNSPAPSSRAASSSSRGSPSKNPFMMKVPKASPNPVYGPISAKGVLSRPSVRGFMKSGIRAIWGGIVRPISTIPTTRRGPAKREGAETVAGERRDRDGRDHRYGRDVDAVPVEPADVAGHPRARIVLGVGRPGDEPPGKELRVVHERKAQ